MKRLISTCAFAVVLAAWADVGKHEMTALLTQVESTFDGSFQSCYFYAPEKAKTEAVPLVVGLHTWSYDWRNVKNDEPVYVYGKTHDWAMVGPNFRGANNRPAACGSDAAVQDVVDAVNFAKAKAKIDAERIYIIGGISGRRVEPMSGSPPDDIERTR